MLGEIGYLLLGLFLLIAPGFLFSLVLYPRKESLDFFERIAVSVGLGVLLLIYVGFIVAKPRMLKLVPFVGAVLALCAFLAFLVYMRGGFEVVLAYKRVVARAFKRFRAAKVQLPKPERIQEQEGEE